MWQRVDMLIAVHALAEKLTHAGPMRWLPLLLAPRRCVGRRELPDPHKHR
jgi:hypothetical protein